MSEIYPASPMGSPVTAGRPATPMTAEELAIVMYDAARLKLSDGLSWPSVLTWDELGDEWHEAWTDGVQVVLDVIAADRDRLADERDRYRGALAEISGQCGCADEQCPASLARQALEG